MKPTTIRVAVLLLLAASIEGAAQERPALPARLDTLTVRYGDTVIGHGVMEWSRAPDTHLQVYVWTSAFDGARVIDSLFSDPTTMRPRREVRVAGDTTHIVDFTDVSLTVSTFVAGQRTAERRLEEPGLHSSASIEALAATVPFVLGEAEELRTFYAPPSRLAVQTTRIVVVARELVDGLPAWRVTASTPGGGTTFWVSEATRTVLRMDTREGDAVITFRRAGAAR